MKLEIELPGVDKIAEDVVEVITDRILNGNDYDGGMRERIRDLAVERVAERVYAETDRIVAEHLAAPIQPTNEFGEPKGDPITLRDRVAQQVKRWLEEKVDRDGKTGRDPFSYQTTKTRAEWAIERAVDEVARKELEAEVRKAATEVKAQLNGKVTEATAATVKRLLGLP